MEALPRSKARQLQAPQRMFLAAASLIGRRPGQKKTPPRGAAPVFRAVQAARLLSKLVFKGSVASVTTFWASVVSSFICADRISNCLRAWSV